MSEPLVLDRIRTMQMLAISAGRGLTWWTTGRVKVERIPAFNSKMEVRHGVNADRSTQRRRRLAELPRTRLVFLRSADNESGAQWWLVSTGPNLAGENMRDATSRDSRIGMGSYFELVRLATRGNGVKWTWRVSLEAWGDFVRRGVHYARARNPAQAQKFVDDLSRWPGSSGLNQQRRELFNKMQAKARGRLVIPRVVYPRFLTLRSEPNRPL